MREDHYIEYSGPCLFALMYDPSPRKKKKLRWPNNEKRCEERTDTSSLRLINISKNRAQAEMHKNQFKRWYPEKFSLRYCTLHKSNMKKRVM